MTVLVLHRGALADSPYHEWLAGYYGRIVLLASAGHLAPGETLPWEHEAYAHVEAFDDYDDHPDVERRALELAVKFGCGYVVACAERDLERAARIRAALDLPGARPAAVLPFRDKWEMKRVAARSGLPVAAQALLTGGGVLRDFVARHGLPVVVKPRRGAGSVGVRVLSEPAEAEAYDAAPVAAAADGEPAELVEAFVPGEMFHVDGLVLDGRIVTMWPFEYLFRLASFRVDRGSRLDLSLDPSDPLTARLLDFAERVLAALPRQRHHAFHIEVFRTPDDELVLCEAACRPPGAALRHVHRAMYGFDPAEAAVRAELALPAAPGAALTGERLAPQAMAGQLLIMKRPGRVRRLAHGVAESSGVTWHRTNAEPGGLLTAPKASSDVLTATVVRAADRAGCESRMRALGARILAETEIVPEG
ncbi:ATP-grasp domain-containing protein [Streptomyces coerulescens]|uniref:Acetyl-CoA carboxylase biotin carboxylase subunit family protein n=1 Tax=Streptomyces coerulescens TaxID=29304 RepID=A0ABW0CJF5_STRCD